MKINPFKKSAPPEPAPVLDEVVEKDELGGNSDEAMAGVELFGAPYKPHMALLAFKFSLLGATEEELAELLGISPNCLKRWRAKYPIFNKSVIEGRHGANAEVAHSLFHAAKGYVRDEEKIFQFQGVPVVVPFRAYYPPDVQAAKHWLALRDKRWRPTEAVDVNLTSTVQNVRISADATPEQAAEMYKRMLG